MNWWFYLNVVQIPQNNMWRDWVLSTCYRRKCVSLSPVGATGIKRNSSIKEFFVFRSFGLKYLLPLENYMYEGFGSWYCCYWYCYIIRCFLGVSLFAFFTVIFWSHVQRKYNLPFSFFLPELPCKFMSKIDNLTSPHFHSTICNNQVHKIYLLTRCLWSIWNHNYLFE